ncbi:CoA transferase [Mesorhizobium sp. WSM3224]|uniref:CoA transferase n=1 Tax=Mesorhizobium sp. WSM3224 TaxID=1040986 RepID=UPI00048153DB|nr:CoA transferase [Mesorhizobium sp. WSM3224]
MTTRPLSNVRVLDFGQYLAGPLVGLMLADLGAEVIRIDPPHGIAFDNPAFDMISRGKQCLTLDLKSKEGRAVAIELARRSDVVIENFRPGVMQRLGLGADVLSAANDGLIYLSLPGFASTDPALRDLAAWEAVIAAYTGQFTDMGLNRRLMGINPSFSPLTLASAYGASFGAHAVLFALYARDRNGGDTIEVPLASALLEGLVYNCLEMENFPSRYKSPRELELERRLRDNLPLNLQFGELSEFLDPFYRNYTCADGRGFYLVSTSISGHPKRALEVLGLTELAEGLPDFSAYLDVADWPSEWTQRASPVGPSDRHRISAAMKQAFLTKPSHEWEALFGAARAPATAQRFSEEWLADPHALASGLILEVEDTRRGRMYQMGNVAWLINDTGAADKRGPIPADLQRLLSEPVRKGGGKEGRGGWLNGLKVLDLTNVIAGPTIGSTLVRYGAQVTTLQPVDPSADPSNSVICGLQAQRGKESILVNLRKEAGQEVLHRLLAQVDVVIVNATDAQCARLNLTADGLAAINPRLIMVQLDAWGGLRRGPKSDHLGYDDTVQAATGIMMRFGGGMQTPEEHAHAGTIDVLGGFCGCIALGAALLRRQDTGKGGVARTSLAAASSLIQAQFMYDYAGRAPFDEPSGRQVIGWGPFYQCYEASDGWIFFAAPTERFGALTRVSELADLAQFSEAELKPKLAERFRSRPAMFWRRNIKGKSSAVPLGSLKKTHDAALVHESDGDLDISRATYRVVRHNTHPMGRWVDLVPPNAVRPRNSKITIPGPMSKYGSHTRLVLGRLGYSSGEIDAMIAEGVAGTSWSEKYLPD